MNINIAAILIPMILGCIAVVISVHGLIRSDMNRRFSEIKEEMNNNKKEIKIEIGEVRLDVKELRSRLDMYIDSFAVRVMAGAHYKKPARR